jgi:hypothetical protein
MSLNMGNQEYNSGKKYRQKGTLCGPNIPPTQGVACPQATHFESESGYRL